MHLTHHDETHEISQDFPNLQPDTRITVLQTSSRRFAPENPQISRLTSPGLSLHDQSEGPGGQVSRLMTLPSLTTGQEPP
jgi:hypothetical protein